MEPVIRGPLTALTSHGLGTGMSVSPAQLLPALKEILRGHFCGLEELVECDRQLNGHILQGATIPAGNGDG